jgi:5-(carboxyamino)imidazole ribonucleotide synthase
VKPIEPGATIGILGSGQLGRMLAYEARRLGYGVAVLSPDDDSPTEAVADRAFVGDYRDADLVDDFIEVVDVVTYEFENVPAETAARCRARVPTHPSAEILEVASDRLKEKEAVRTAGFGTTEFRAVRDADELEAGLAAQGPSILKTVRSGYDGKGQAALDPAVDAGLAWRAFGADVGILEKRVDFEKEISVVVGRGADGRCVPFEPFENDHANHILDVTVCPAQISPSTRTAALEVATGLADALGVVGVLCVEMFVTREGDVLVNEMAPRPHNSGHLTLDACRTSQFEQQLRAVCGLPLGDPELLAPAAMVNLLGDRWHVGEDGEPVLGGLEAIFLEARARLHLYGKRVPRPGRKMGHLTVVGPDVARARDVARALRAGMNPDSEE